MLVTAFEGFEAAARFSTRTKGLPVFLPSFKPTPEKQVWPGNGIDVFSIRGAPLRVVSTYSRFLNGERWYFASAPSSWASEFTMYRGLPQSKPEDVDHWSFVDSYLDRAVLTEEDWITYAPPTPEASLGSRSYEAELTPALIQDQGPLPPRIVIAPAISVWVQFLTLNEVLLRTAWFIEDRVDWGAGHWRCPSAFLITNDTPFHESAPPASGIRYTGGLRPTPWTG